MGGLDSKRPAPVLTCEEIAGLDGNAALLDVREIGEYEVAHVPGATTLARARLESDARQVVPDLEATVVVYDGADGRAELARRTLVSMGYGRVFVLKGGIPEWIATGRPTRSGTNVPSKLFGEQLLEADRVQEISPGELEKARRGDEGPLVLDIRTRAEHERGCIPGAWHVPGGELISIAGDLRKLDRPIITHCAGRTRGIVAAATLGVLGVQNVRALRNGTMGWMLADMDLEVPTEDRSMRASDASLAEAVDRASLLRDSRNVPSVDARWLMTETALRTRPLYIFDVRQRSEYETGHIAGSVHVAAAQLIQCADDHIALRNLDIVLVSGVGTRATVATWWLRRMGYPRAWTLAGGLDGWSLAGGSLERQTGHEPQPRGATPLISAAALEWALGAEGVVVLDLGTSARYERRHVPTAHWISRGSLEMVIPQRLPVRTTPIVLTGADSSNAELAAATLREMDYEDVRVLDISLREWSTEGHVVEQGLQGCWSEPCDIPYRAILRGDRNAMRRYLDWETTLNEAPPPRGLEGQPQ